MIELSIVGIVLSLINLCIVGSMVIVCHSRRKLTSKDKDKKWSEILEEVVKEIK